MRIDLLRQARHQERRHHEQLEPETVRLRESGAHHLTDSHPSGEALLDLLREGESRGGSVSPVKLRRRCGRSRWSGLPSGRVEAVPSDGQFLLRTMDGRLRILAHVLAGHTGMPSLTMFWAM